MRYYCIIAMMCAVSLLFLGCAAGDWGAYKDQDFWHRRDKQSGGGP